MKPLNLDNSPCSPIASNCVIWAGDDIPCIKLCKGDTVSDVVAKLATELCTILDTLDIKNYDLSCFNLTSCAPSDFQALINFLIQKICELENIPAPENNTRGTGCPTDCPVSVPDCLATSPGEVLNLIDYVNLIATRVCNLATDISILQSAVNVLQNNVTALQITVAGLSNYTTPEKAITCDIGSLTAPGSYPIDDIISEFINSEWCPISLVLDTPFNLSNAISSQSPCYDGTAPALQYVYTSGAIMQVAYPTYAASPATLAEAIENIWIALCDLRNAGKKLTLVSGGNNITVTTATTIIGNDEETEYTINGLSTNVFGGDNISVSSVSYPNGTTDYTIYANGTNVVGADDIVVTPVTVGNDTTYTISRPKITFYQEAQGLVNVLLDPVPDSTQYHFPIGYNALTYTNTTGVTKTFTVHVSYIGVVGINDVVNSSSFSNQLDGAIITTAFAVDTVAYESIGARVAISGSLYDGPNPTDIVNIGTTETVVTTPGTNPVEFRFLDGNATRHVSFFKLITINNGESISLKFKSDGTNNAYISQAQILIQEI